MTAVADARRNLRLLGYVLAEAIPTKRQGLQIPLIPTITTQTTTAMDDNNRTQHPHVYHAAGPGIAASTPVQSIMSTTALGAGTASRLRAECASRGVSLDTVLLTSLFLAAADAKRIEGTRRERGKTDRPASVRIQRGIVLGVICVVMALLSGSVDSKILRYFCSVYAVIAGIVVHRPGTRWCIL